MRIISVDGRDKEVPTSFLDLQDWSYARYATKGVYTITDPQFAGGADPTGVADSTAAIKAARDASIAGGGGPVWCPPGTFRITESGVFSSIGESNKFGPKYIGAGRRLTTLELDVNDATEKWFYDNGTGTRRLAHGTFEDIHFTSTDVAYGNGFKYWSNGHEKGDVFNRCRFTSLGTAIHTHGTANASEFRFIACTFKVPNVLYLDNSQSVNHDFLSCYMEFSGDCFVSASANGGGIVRVLGGSMIHETTATTDHWLVNYDDSLWSTAFMFIGVKTEMRTVYAKLFKTGVGQSRISIVDSDFAPVTGGSREAVNVGTNTEIVFERCHIPPDLTFQVNDNVSGLGYQVDKNGVLKFLDCWVDEDLLDQFTLNTYGGVVLRGCRTDDNTVETWPSTTHNRYALDADLNWQNNAGVRCSSVPVKTVSLGPLAIREWPYNSSHEYRVRLPAGAVLRGVHVLKQAGGSDTDTYQLHVGNDDKTTIYGSSVSGQQDAEHSISVDLSVNVGVTDNERWVRLWSTGSNHSALNGQSGDFAFVEYV